MSQHLVDAQEPLPSGAEANSSDARLLLAWRFCLHAAACALPELGSCACSASQVAWTLPWLARFRVKREIKDSPCFRRFCCRLRLLLPPPMAQATPQHAPQAGTASAVTGIIAGWGIAGDEAIRAASRRLEAAAAAAAPGRQPTPRRSSTAPQMMLLERRRLSKSCARA
jgi:hypothetical protein